MPLFIPFRRAGLQEKVVQLAVVASGVFAALVAVVPFIYMMASSLGDLDDVIAGRSLPRLGYLTKPDRLYVKHLAMRYDNHPAWTDFNLFYGTNSYELSKADSEMIADLGGLEAKVADKLCGNWRVRAADGLDCLNNGGISWLQKGILFKSWAYWDFGGMASSNSGLGQLLWKRHLKAKFGTVERVNQAYGTDYRRLAQIRIPEIPPLDSVAELTIDPMVLDYAAFIDRPFDPEWRVFRSVEERFRWYCWLEKAGGDPARMAGLGGLGGTEWKETRLPLSAPGAGSTERVLWESFVRKNLPTQLLGLKVTPGLTAKFRKHLASRHGSMDQVKMIYGTTADLVALPASAPLSSATMFSDWASFARSAPAEALEARTGENIWRSWLEAKYGTIGNLNSSWGVSFAGFNVIEWPQAEIDRLDWERHWKRYVVEMLGRNFRSAWSYLTESVPAVQNTVVFVLVFCLLSIILNTCAAYVLSRFNLRISQVLLVFLLALSAVPLEALSIPSFLFLKEVGLLNTVGALILPMLVNGYFIFLLKGAFDAIPNSYFEEAALCGAGEWQIFRHIGIPMALPMIGVVALYSFLWSYGNFMWALMVCQNPFEWTIPVAIFHMKAENIALPILSAAVLISSIPVLILFMATGRFIRGGNISTNA
jgi:ABC-type glycerol-3-phosphate transport system permease component